MTRLGIRAVLVETVPVQKTKKSMKIGVFSEHFLNSLVTTEFHPNK